MAGLFDFTNPQQAGLLALSQGLLQAGAPSTKYIGFGQALSNGLGAMQKAQQSSMDNAYEQQLRDYKLGEIKQTLADREAAKQRAMQVQGLIQQFGNDYAGMVRSGVPYETVKQLADSQNLGMPEVARTVELAGADGGKSISQLDKFGRSVGAPIAGYVAPQLIPQGDKLTFATPKVGASFPIGLSPAQIAENQRANARLAQDERHYQGNQALKREELTSKTGAKQPMSAALQKELIESDDVMQSSKNVIYALNEAKKVNKQAYSGWGASTRAKIVSNLGGTESADATVSLDNLVSGQALENLKLIFGGNPTEGERRVLLDMQASADKTPDQREAILNRAIKLAEVRGKYAENKAKSLRSGTYLTEGVPEPTMDDKPPPNENQGKTILDHSTGKKYKSNGMQWVEVQ